MKGEQLSRMLVLATNRHDGQFDKGGNPYILHPLKVMHYLKTDDEDPKLKRTSVTVRYTADDGYRSETTYTTSGHHPPIPPEVPLLDALEELARLTALFGFCDEAKALFDAAQKRVSDFREGRKVGAGETATEGHNA